MIKFTAFLNKIGKRRLWEGLAVAFASLLVLFSAGYDIAVANSATINNAFNIGGSEIERSDEEQYQYFKREYTTEDSLEKFYSEVAGQAEAEGLVLLKNDGALPIKSGSAVSLVLTGAADIAYGSSGSSALPTTTYSDFKGAMEAEGFKVNEELWNFYTTGGGKKYGRTTRGTNYLMNEAPLSAYGNVLDNISGTAIAVITRDTGEGKDINMSGAGTVDGSYLTLSKQELEVLDKLTELKEAKKIDNIVILLNSSASIQLDFLFGTTSVTVEDKDDKGNVTGTHVEKFDVDADAVMWIGYPGKYGLASVAKALSGKVNPSGRLTDTFVRNNLSSPAAASDALGGGFAQQYSNASAYSLNNTQSSYGIYVEGIYVGYRYYETRYTDAVNGAGNTTGYNYSADVAYPFGYGLSYSTYEYSDFSVTPSQDGETFTISVTVTNIGKTAGKEVVQVYLQKPYTDYDKEHGVEKAAVELAGYAKTQELAPDGKGSETVKIEVSREEFKSYDTSYNNGTGSYIVDDGTYYFTVADNAHDAANNILGYASKDAKTDRVSAAYYNISSSNDGMVYAVEEDKFDAASYANSETGAPVTNKLNESDINKYSGRGDNSVTYVSRSDWNGTFPKAAATITLTEKMAADLASNKPIEEDSEAKMPIYGANNGISIAAMRGKDYNHEDWQKVLDEMTWAEQALLISNAGFTTVAVSSVAKPDTSEYDGPTGFVKSTGARSMPCQGVWAATFNNEIVEDIGKALAEDALNAGYTGLYANGANLHRSPFGGRSAEYFSEDSYLAGVMSMHEIQGMQSKGVIAHVKHVAFNDMEDQRSGIAVWLNEQEARELMLEVFDYALSPSKGNGHAMMSGFNRVGTVWAGAHNALLNDIVRGEFGFDGYCITDMADSNGAYYMTYQDGVTGGTDCWLGNGSGEALDAFRGNAVFAQDMRESCHRILYAVANYSAAMNGITPDTMVNRSMPWWQTTIIAAISVAAVLTAVFGAMYVYCIVRDRLAAARK